MSLPDNAELIAGVLSGDVTALARAITLVESSREEHLGRAESLVDEILPKAGGAFRVGITGVPGVGKSTFIDALGMELVGRGHRVAVLAVDPSSELRGGSLLGDKTRMRRLAVEPRAFVRPSPTSGALGGVTRATREALLLCEAAGHDVVLVETVGVGQSEIVVSEMTDSFLALLLPGAGDELQSIKRGLLEWVDVIAVNKADDERVHDAQRAAQDSRNALQYLTPRDPNWSVPVLTCSARDGDGVSEVWAALETHRTHLANGSRLRDKRAAQNWRWLERWLDVALRRRLWSSPAAAGLRRDLEPAVRAGEISVAKAGRRLLAALTGSAAPSDEDGASQDPRQ